MMKPAVTLPCTLFLIGAAFAAGGWIDLRGDNYVLHHRAGSDKDASDVKAMADASMSSLRSYFRELQPDMLLRTVTIDIYLHDTPNDKASEGTATAMTQGDGYGPDSAYRMELHFLVPSRFGTESRTMMNEPKDANYHAKTMAHELSTAFLERALRIKSCGWRSGAPSWFVQGYQEYLGLTCSNDHNRTVMLKKYVEALRKSPGRVQEAWGIRVENDYLDGAVLLAYMHDVYGPSRVKGILTSEKPTFGEAIESSLRVTQRSFYEGYWKWVSDLPVTATSRPVFGQ